MRLMLPFALAAIFFLAGVILDGNYQRSTPDPISVQGTVIGFERPHRRTPLGRSHRPVDLGARRRCSTGDREPAGSQLGSERHLGNR